MSFERSHGEGDFLAYQSPLLPSVLDVAVLSKALLAAAAEAKLVGVCVGILYGRKSPRRLKSALKMESGISEDGKLFID